jgi:hypothetical protein
MMNKKGPDPLTLLSDIVLIGAALLSIGVTLLDFLGVLDQVKWLSERVGILTLLSLSFLLVSIVIERKRRLDTIQNTLDNIIDTYILGAQYLDDSESVTTELERVVRQADEIVMALGARSRAVSYLKAIESAVSQRSVIYYRLLDSTDITHELHEHLQTLVHAPNVHIAWTPKEKFGNLTVTEHECVIAFPAPYRNKLSGLRLPGDTNSRRYTQYFLEVFSEGLPIRTEHSIEILCERCGSNTAGNVEQIRRILGEELQALASKQSTTKSGLL